MSDILDEINLTSQVLAAWEALVQQQCVLHQHILRKEPPGIERAHELKDGRVVVVVNLGEWLEIFLHVPNRQWMRTAGRN